MYGERKHLKNNIGMRASHHGDHLLTLDGGAGFRVFGGNSTNGTPLLLPGQSLTNSAIPADIWVEARSNGTATLTYDYASTPTRSDPPVTHHRAFPLTAWEVAWPQGDTIGTSNYISWRGYDEGLVAHNHFKILPASLDAEIYWSFDPNDFPEPQFTKIKWEPCDPNRPHVGMGPNPKLTVTYENPQSKYDDYMPPDNRWFGKKTLTIKVGNETVVRPVWVFFTNLEAAPRTTRGLFGKKEAQWFNYYLESRAVPGMADFIYNASMKKKGEHSWTPGIGDEYVLGYAAILPADKPVFNVNVANSYSEMPYPYPEGLGVHAVAKICAHEGWHAKLSREVRWKILGGDGKSDSDGDGLSDDREEELKTNPNVKDTCGISLYCIEYSDYASYADQELFCRWKEIEVQGEASKDWALNGAQSPFKPAN